MPSDRRAETELEAITREGVNLELAVQCVELSRLAYAPAEQGARRARRYGYEQYRNITQRNGRDYVMIVSDKHRHFVAFRGSDEVRDWLTNLSLWNVSTSVGTVHRGYYGVSRRLLPELRTLLEELPPKPLVFTGHSMGGALALLTAVELVAEGVEIESLYTFGQPRAGGAVFDAFVEREFSVPYFRFVHGADAFATWGYGQRARSGRTCYFDIRGRLGFGGQLRQLPRLNLRFHRLEHYRYFLRLNRLRLQAITEDDDVTLIQDDSP